MVRIKNICPVSLAKSKYYSEQAAIRKLAAINRQNIIEKLHNRDYSGCKIRKKIQG